MAEELEITSRVQFHKALSIQERLQLILHLDIPILEVLIWIPQQEGRMNGRVNAIGCLFHLALPLLYQVLQPALLLCQIQELFLLKVQMVICQNGRKAGFWEEAHLAMFILDSTGVDALPSII